MSLYYKVSGKREAPILVAVHGLMGGIEELKFLEKLSTHFFIIFVDFHVALKKVSIAQRDLKTVEYDKGADFIADILKNDFNGRSAFFYGSSYGGKIIFDLMAKYPSCYSGGVFGDISPAPIEDTEFYELTYKVVPQLDMTKPWKELKAQIKSLVSDRNARSLLASQIYYPKSGESAMWRTGVHKLNDVMAELNINNQWPIFNKVCQVREKKNIILVAEKLSSISANSREKLKESGAFELIDTSDSTHFINITHHKLIIKALLSLLD